jgi:hypothetical protein
MVVRIAGKRHPQFAIGVAVDHVGLAGERQPVLIPQPLVLDIDVGHREVEHRPAAEFGAFRHAQVQPYVAAGEDAMGMPGTWNSSGMPSTSR